MNADDERDLAASWIGREPTRLIQLVQELVTR